MSRIIFCAVLALSMFVTTAVRADPQTDISAAIANLSNASSYTWSTTAATKLSTFFGGKIDGKHESSYTESGQLERDGYAEHTANSVDGPIEVYSKGNKLVIHGKSGYHTTQPSVSSEDGNPKARNHNETERDDMPDAQLKKMGGELENFAFSDGVYTADLNLEAAKAIVAPRPGMLQDIKDVKFSFKFWITDGLLTKIEEHAVCAFANGSHLITHELTQTMLIKDVGSTKIDLPAEVKAGLDGPNAPPN